jgi:hypothetical protein
VEPVWWIKLGAFSLNDGKTNQVTLGHLACTTFYDWQVKTSSSLIDDTGLANAVTTTEKNRLLYRSNMRSDFCECCEIY